MLNFKYMTKKITLFLGFITLFITGFIQAQVLTQSFDDTTFPPTGWTNVQVAGTGTTSTWNQTATGTYPTCTPHTGAGMARYNSFSFSSGKMADLSTSILDLTTGGPHRITFWMYRDNGYLSNADMVEVYVNTSQASSGGTLVGTVNRSINLSPVVSATGWYQYIFNIPATFNSATNYVIFKAISAYGNNMFIDDVVVESSPACPNPTALSASGITNTGATLNWTAGLSETEWNVEYGINGFTLGSGTQLNALTTNSTTLSSLTAGTAYQFYVQAVCSTSLSSPWSGPYSFTTLPNPPANDNCSAAIALTVNPDYLCGTVTAGTLVGATASGVDETACSGTENDDVWFSFVATNTTHQISLTNVAGTPTDLYHSLWTGDCTALTLVSGSCSDANTSNPTGLTVGTTYYVRVNSYSSAAGANTTFSVCIGTPPPPPTNDNCSGAIALTVNPDYLCGTVTAGTIAGATASGVDETACFGTENDDVWFSFVATNTVHRISLTNVTGSPTDMYHSLWTGDCTALTLVTGSCSDADTSNPSGLTVGTTYYVRVNSYSSTGGANTNFNVCVGTPPPPPANDNFANAAVVVCGNQYTGSTELATLDEDNAPDGFGADMDARNVWYSFTGTGIEQTVTLNLCNSSYDTSVLVYTGTSGNLTLIAANDDDSTCGTSLTTRSRVSFTSDGTTTYYIAIEGWNSSSYGAYVMDVTCANVNPPAVTNQSCSLALAVSVDGVDVTSDNSYGTVNPVQPSCDIFGSIQDVWFSFVAPTSGSVDCVITPVAMTSANFNIYSGSCTTLTEISGTCNSNLTATTTENLTELTAGATYYVQVWSNAAEQGTFTINLSDPTMSIADNYIEGFRMYPNPTNDFLNLKANSKIESVSIYNMLGQEVMRSDIANETLQINVSNLPNGNYVVKVVSGNVIGAYNFIKM